MMCLLNKEVDQGQKSSHRGYKWQSCNVMRSVYRLACHGIQNAKPGSQVRGSQDFPTELIYTLSCAGEGLCLGLNVPERPFSFHAATSPPG